jgi:1,4-dihydroxy-2-naphthoate octaprenyltransferase
MHSTKKENPISQNSLNVVKNYLIATRPKTLIASISPVLIGSALSLREGIFSFSIFFLTLFFALCMQIGTNYANDCFDFLKNVDTKERKGPKRAVEQGWISPQAMANAAYAVLSLGIIIAIPLMLKAGFWSWPLAALTAAAALFYTAGPKPLAYLGLGELTAFFFFGPFAVLGTYFLQTETISLPATLASLAPGFLCAAILLANNLRDEATDTAAHKKTIVVRFGSIVSSKIYFFLLFGAEIIPIFLTLFYSQAMLLISLGMFFAPFWIKNDLLTEKEPLLGKTAFILAAYTLSFCLLVQW